MLPDGRRQIVAFALPGDFLWIAILLPIYLFGRCDQRSCNSASFYEKVSLPPCKLIRKSLYLLLEVALQEI